METTSTRPTMMLAVALAVLTTLTFSASAARAQTPRPGAQLRSGFRIADLNYGDLGATTLRRNARGAWLLTLDQTGVGVAACNGNGACESLGVEGQAVMVKQDLQIVIDVISAGVIAIDGRARGELSTNVAGRNVSAEFKGTLDGEVSCAADVCTVQLTLEALAAGGAALELNLNGVAILSDAAPEWIEMAGAGHLAIGPGIFP